jgi:exocyst complex protein 7
MGAESVGSPWAPRRAQPSEGFAKLLAARSALCQSLEKSRALGQLLDQSDKRLQTVQERLSPVRRALAPLEVQSKVTEELTQRIDQTLEPAMSVLSMFDVVSKIRVRLLREPKDDFDGYMAAILQLEDAVDYLKQHSFVAVKWLQEAVAYLNQTNSTDTLRIRRLTESLATLKSQQAGNHLSHSVFKPSQFFSRVYVTVLCCDFAGGVHQLDGGLFVTTLGKLEKEFKRLLHEHSHRVELPEEMDSQGETPTSSSEIGYLVSYPPDVVEKLQAIIGKLVGHPNYQRCINAYQETRGALCEESLQVSACVS